MAKKFEKMTSLTQEQIKEIAEMLDCGFRCYFNRQTAQLLTLPDFNNNSYADEELYADAIEELETNFADYIEIERPQPHDNFNLMANFTDRLNDKNELKKRLTSALNKKKPFREFKFVIDNSGTYRQQWFDFKNAQLGQWVSERFDEAICYERMNGST